MKNVVQNSNYRIENDDNFNIFEAAFNSSSQGIILTDLKGEIINVNKTVLEIWGFSKNKKINKFRDLNIPKKIYKDLIEKTLTKGTCSKEIISKHKDGSKFTIQINADLISDEAGTQKGIMLAVSYISAGKAIKTNLLETEDHFNKIMSLSIDGIWDWNLNTNEVHYDPGYYKVAGYEVNEFPHRLEQFEKRVHPDDIDRVMETAKKYLENKIPDYNTEFRFKSKNGEWLWINGRGIISQRDENGKPIRFSGIHTDITKRKIAEQAIHNSEEKFRRIFNSYIDVYVETGLDGKVIEISPSIEKLSGYTREEIIGTDAVNFYADTEKRKDMLKQLSEKGYIQNLDVDLLKKDGQTIPVSVNSRFEFDSLGNPVKLISILRDNSERKNAEQVIRNSEEKFRNIFNSFMDVYLETDADGKIIEISPSIEKYGGYTREEMIGKSTINFYADPKARQKLMAELSQKGYAHDVDIDYLKKNGEIITLSTNSRIVKDSKGNFLKLIATLHDITERKRAEKIKNENLTFLQGIDKVNKTIQKSNTQKQMLQNVLEAIKSIFKCDRAWLLYPCDPDSPTFRVPFESSTPDYPGAFLLDLELPMKPDADDVCRRCLENDSPDTYGPGNEYKISSSLKKHHDVQSQIVMAIHPKNTIPWMLGMHQCSQERIWTDLEKRLFREISNRLSDSLSTFLAINKLKESEEKFRRITNNAKDVIYRMSLPDGKYEFISPAAKKIFGHSPKEFIENPLLVQDLIHPDFKDYFIEQWNDLIKGKMPPTYEYKIIKSGKERWLYQRNVLIKDKDKKPVAIEGVVTDITERKKAEKELKSNLYILKCLNKIDKVIRTGTDANKILSKVMDAMLEMFDCDRAWLLYPVDPNAPSWSVPIESTKPEYPGAFALNQEIPMTDEARKVMNAALKTNEPMAFDPSTTNELPPKTAERFIYLSQLTIIIYPKIGSPWHLGMHQCTHARIWTIEEKKLFREISRRIADALSVLLIFRDLKESEERYRTLFETANDGIVILDDLVIVECNDMILNMFGYTDKLDIIGKTPWDLSPEKQFNDINSEIRVREIIESAKKGEVQHFEWIHKNSMSELFYVDIVLNELKTGEKRLYIAIIRDITEKKKTERELKSNLYLLECLNKIDKVIRVGTDAEEVMSRVIETMLEMFDSDRAWLLYPCDPDAPSWRVPIESTKPEYPGAFLLREDIPMTDEMAKVLRTVLERDDTLVFDPTTTNELPPDNAREFIYRSQILHPIYPKIGSPWILGMHQCSYARIWTKEEKKLVKEISGKIRDALSVLLIFRNLKENEERYRAIFETASDVIFILDGVKIIECNKMALAMFECSKKEELLGKTVVELSPEKQSDGTSTQEKANYYLETVKKGNPMLFEWLHITMKGKLFIAEIRFNKFSIEDKSLFVGIVRDITERKRAEEDLNKKQKMLNRTQEIAKLGCFDWEFSTGHVMYSDEMCNIYGLDPKTFDENIETSLLKAIHPEDREMVKLANTKVLSMDQIPPLDFRILLPNGTERNIFATGDFVFDKNGNKTGMIGIVQDITERVKTENELKSNLYLLECLDKIDKVVRAGTDAELVMTKVMDVVLETFDCDRAWLLYPCDPDAPSWSVPFEGTKPEYPDIFKLNQKMPMTKNIANNLKKALKSDRPIYETFEPGEPENLGEYYICSNLIKAVYPKTGKPWQFGIHQCSHKRIWTQEEINLFNEISEKIGDALNMLLLFQALKESEERYRILFRDTNDPMLIADDFRFIDCNSRAVEILEMDSKEELLKLGPLDISPEFQPDGKNSLEQIKKCKEIALTKGSTRIEWTYKKKSGEEFPVEVTLTAIIIKGKKIIHVAWRDITKRKKVENALKQSEEQYRTLFETANDVIYILESNKYIDCNSMALKMFDYKNKQDIIGKTPWELSPEKQADGKNSEEKAKKIFMNAKKGIPQSIEWIHTTSKGNILYTDVALNMFEIGNRTLFMAVVRDITEKKKTEEALKESEERYRILFESANDPMLIQDEEKYLDCNIRAVKILEMDSKEELILSTPWDLSPEFQPDGQKSIEKAKKLINTAIKNGNIRFEWIHKKKSGKEFPVEVTLTLVKLKGNKLIHVVWRDITARKQAEFLIKQSEKKFREIFNNANDAMYFYKIPVKNKFSKFLEVNEVACKLLGYSKEEFMRMSSKDIYSLEQLKAYKEKIKELLKKGHLRWYTNYVSKSGEEIPFEVNSLVFNIMNEDYILSVARDIRERKKQERERQELIRGLEISLENEQNAYESLEASYEELEVTKIELEDVNRQLETALEKAEAANKLKQELLAIMSHEIRTPLSGIIGFTDLILSDLEKKQKSPADEKHLKFINFVSKASHRLNELLNNLLALSTIEAGKKHAINYKEFDVRAMINDIFILLNERIKNNNIETTVILKMQDVIRCDQFRLQQILFNLIGNATKFTKNGNVKIKIKQDDEKYYFEIKDTGIGIAKEKFNEIFDIFTQVDNRTTLRDYQGVGLGLSVVKRMVNELGGKIGVESKLNIGSVFYFEIPKAPASETVKSIKKDTRKRKSNYIIQDLKVLFAEDDLINHNVLKSSLSAIGAVKKDGYYDGIKLLNQFKNDQDYNVIIVDIQMPAMDGVECMKRIKKINNNIPVIALTAFAMHDDKDKFLNLGFDEYLGKPFNYKELYKVLVEFLY